MTEKAKDAIPNPIGRKVKQVQFGIGVQIGTEVSTGLDVKHWADVKKKKIVGTVIPGAVFFETDDQEVVIPFANCKQIHLLPEK